MLGDPVDTHPVAAFLMSPEFKTAGITSAFFAAAGAISGGDHQSLIEASPKLFMLNMFISSIHKYILDKIVLLFSFSSTNMEIEKAPSSHQAKRSVLKYSSSAKKAKKGYAAGGGGLFLFCSTLFSVTTNDVPTGVMFSTLVCSSSLVRTFNNIRGMSKILSGEWAVVSGPSQRPTKPPEHKYTHVPALHF